MATATSFKNREFGLKPARNTAGKPATPPFRQKNGG